MAGLNFANSHNMVAYLEKSTKNADFAEIVDFLNANPIRVNAVYDTLSYTKKIFANMRRQRKDFSRTVTPLFLSMLVQQAYMGEGSGQPTDPQHTFTSAQPSHKEPITIPSSLQPKKTHRPSKAKRATEISQSSGPISLVADETVTKETEDRIERVATTASSLEVEQDNEAQTRFETASKQSNDPPLSRVNTHGSGEDRLKLKELMELCTKLSDRVYDLETTKTAQAKEISSLKKRVKNLERKRKSKTLGMNLFKIESDFDDEGFDVDMDEVFKDVEGDAEQVISAAVDEVSTGDAVNTAGTEVYTASAPVTTAGVSVSTAEPITTASVNINTAEPITPPTTITTIFEDEDLTIAQTLVKMRSEKSKMQAKLEEEERLAREREEDANITEWDNAQAMKDADYELAARIHAQDQEELTIEKKSRLFVELMDKRKKHFARLRAEEQRRKPLTKAQKRSQMCTYLKNMAGFTHNQVKNKSFDEVQKAFDKTMSWIDSFVSMDSEVVKGRKDRAEGSETRAE
ncbi:hypothetical protein Tco_1243082 [Tanacetum coccineum]